MLFYKLLLLFLSVSLRQVLAADPVWLTSQDEWWNGTLWIDQGYCTYLSSPDLVTLMEGVPFNFSIISYDYYCGRTNCNAQGQYCAACQKCRYYTGTPLVFNITIQSLQGIAAPNTTCTVRNYSVSAYGAYPVSCIANNSLAGTTQGYYVNVGFDSAYIQRGQPMEQINSSILAATINTHPLVVYTAGSVNAASCVGQWYTDWDGVASNSTWCTVQAGNVAWFTVQQFDSFGNIVWQNTGSAETVSFDCYFQLSQQNVTVAPGGVRQAGFSVVHPSTAIAVQRANSDFAWGLYSLSFTPQVVGTFKFFVTLHGTYIKNIPATFTVTPGLIDITSSIGTWDNEVNTFPMGAQAVFRVTLYDSFNNTVPITSNFYLQVVFLALDKTQLGNIEYSGAADPSKSQWAVTFSPTWGVGSFYLQIGSSTQLVRDSPYIFNVTVGEFVLGATIGKWYNSVNNFGAGTTGYLTVEQMDGFGQLIFVENSSQIYNFDVSVMNYPAAISKYSLSIAPDTNISGNVAILFKPTQYGQFSLHVGSKTADISGSPFSFNVTAGPVFVPACEGNWANGTEFVAGNQASLQVLQKDNFGNIVGSATGSYEVYDFDASIADYNTSIFVVPDLSSGLQTLNFLATTAGNFAMTVSSPNRAQNISNSPLWFSVISGPISVAACTGSWYKGVSEVNVGASVELIISLMDAHSNPVSTLEAGTVSFIPTLFLVGTVVPITISDLITRPLTSSSNLPNQLSLSFTVAQPGQYVLQVGDGTTYIQGSPFQFSVFPNVIATAGGSIIEGEGLGNSYAGELSQFVIELKDSSGNPSSELEETLVVKIAEVESGDTIPVDVALSDEAIGEYFVTYNATISGYYYINVSWNNTVLASNYRKLVYAGPLDPSSCTASGTGLQGGVAGDVLTFEIHLKDIYNNTVVSYNTTAFISIDPRTNLQVSSVNGGKKGVISVKYMISLARAQPYSLSVSVGSVSPGTPILGSSFSVVITPGNVSIPLCSGEWQNSITTFTVGVRANFIIREIDSKGNPVYAVADSTVFMVQALSTVSSSPKTPISMTFNPLGNGSAEMLLFSFTMHEAGNYILQVGSSSESIPGSFYFSYFPGQLSIVNCTGGWLNGIKTYRVGGVASFILVARDMYGNSISAGVNDLSARIDQSSSVLKVANLKIQQQNSTAQLVTFILSTSGKFNLRIGDSAGSSFTDPYPFTYLSGDVYPPKCTGSFLGGIQTIKVGLVATFITTLRDQYSNLISPEVVGIITVPNLIPKLFRLGVHVLVDVGSVFQPINNGTSYLLNFTMSQPGTYNLYVESGNVGILGSPFSFSVTAGAQNASSSVVGGIGLSSKASTQYWDEIDVHLKDSFGNPTVADASLFGFYITGPGPVLKQSFVDVGGGKYIMFYKPSKQGNYNISLSIQGQMFPGSPFLVSVGALNGSSILEWPHVTSTPDLLEGLEGAVIACDSKGSYFEVSSINLTSSVTVQVSAKHGSVFLPANMYIMGSNLKIWPTNPLHPGDLKYSGTIGPVNQALLALLYEGDKHFNGNDSITVTVLDAQGHQDTQSSIVMLDPYNDPPFIDVPDAVKIATNKGAVEPPIVVGDPDNTDANGQRLQLEITLTVQGGNLLLSLPRHTNYSTGGQLNSEDLQTRPLELSKFPHVKGEQNFHSRVVSFGNSGIVFRATVAVCNQALATMQFQPKSGTGGVPVMHIAVSDLGNFGCYGACDSDVPYPLFAQADVKIVPFKASRAPGFRTIGGSTIGSVGFVGIVMGLIVWGKRRYFRKLKVAALREDEGFEDDFKEIRTYNPIWKPDAERTASFSQPERLQAYAQHVADEADGPDLSGAELVHLLQKRVSSKLEDLVHAQKTEQSQPPMSGRRRSSLGQVAGEEEISHIAYEYDNENYVRALNRTWAPDAGDAPGGVYSGHPASRPSLSYSRASFTEEPRASYQQGHGQAATFQPQSDSPFSQEVDYAQGTTFQPGRSSSYDQDVGYAQGSVLSSSYQQELQKSRSASFFQPDFLQNQQLPTKERQAEAPSFYRGEDPAWSHQQYETEAFLDPSSGRQQYYDPEE